MAKREVSKEATGGTGWRISCFLLAYLHRLTSEPSDEAKAEAPPSLPSSPRRDPESLTLPLPSSSFNSSPDNILITVPYISTPSAVPPPPPQPSPPQNDNLNMNTVIGIMRDQELGKATLAFSIPIGLALLTSGKDKLSQSEMSFILIALTVGCAAIWNGILLRNTFPKTAQVLEPLGIALVVISFNGLVAFLLPVEFRWVPAVCIGLSLLPFIIAAWNPGPG